MKADGSDTGGYVRLSVHVNGLQRVITVTQRADHIVYWEVDVREDTTQGILKLTARGQFKHFDAAINQAMKWLLSGPDAEESAS